MLYNKVPRNSKDQVIPPILAVAAGGGNKTPQMMLDVLQYCVDNKMPFDTYWVDAGWYGEPHEDELYSNCGPNWWKYVGDWRVNTTVHPSGDLLPIANAVHKAGLKFLLWFEPERMTDSSPILKTHPEYRHGQLVDFGNPDALRWIQNTVYGMIAKHKIDVYSSRLQHGPRWRLARHGLARSRWNRRGKSIIAGCTSSWKTCGHDSRYPARELRVWRATDRHGDDLAVSHLLPQDYYIGQKPADTAFIPRPELRRSTPALFALPGLRVQLRAGRRRLRGV